MKRRMRVSMFDPHGVCVEEDEFDVVLDPSNDDNPDDPKVQEQIAPWVGKFVGAMVAGGLTCTVDVTDITEGEPC